MQVAVANATVGSPGEDGGLDTDFDQGVLTIAEAGWTGRGKLALGLWRFSEDMDDQRDTDAFGAPLRRTPQGAYVIAEQPVGGRASAFLRIGISDGDTQPLKSSWQAGVQMQPVFEARPDSTLAFGVSQARLAKGFRANAADAGLDLDQAETLIELTYSDLLTEHVRIQPDLQYVRRPSADRSLKDAVVLGLRLNVAF